MRQKRYLLNTQQNLETLLQIYSEKNLFTDLGFLANIDVKNTEDAVQLCRDQRVFGFWSSLDPPPNKNFSFLKNKR